MMVYVSCTAAPPSSRNCSQHMYIYHIEFLGYFLFVMSRDDGIFLLSTYFTRGIVCVSLLHYASVIEATKG